MKIIKFRVWNKNENQYDDPSLVEIFNSNGVLGHLYDEKQEYTVIEQFIGLFDKNGKEIYENDIIRYVGPFSKVGTFDNIFIIVYQYGRFRLKHIKSGETFVDFSESNNFNTVQSSEIEIIANIHENK